MFFTRPAPFALKPGARPPIIRARINDQFFFRHPPAKLTVFGDLAESGTELVLTLPDGQSKTFARLKVVRTP